MTALRAVIARRLSEATHTRLSMLERWLIGLSLGSHELGPLEFGAWLQETTGAQLQAMHVATVPSLPQRYLTELETDLGQLLDKRIAAAGLADVISTPEVRLEGKSVAAELVKRASGLGAGLIIGRSAPRSAERIIRLGRVARRVLRRLPAVVGVVPPDLTRGDLGSGPLILGVDAHSDTDGAVAFARGLAEQTGRELVLVHVFDPVGEASVRFVPPDLARRFRLAWRDEAEVALEAYIRRHELNDLRLLTADGSAVDQLLEITEREKASILICGSRLLSATDRVFVGSVGSMLAALSSTPVFVVPP